MDAETLKLIEDKIELIRITDSPDLLSTLRLELATYNYTVGQAMVSAEFAYKVELNRIMRTDNTTAASAKIQAEAQEGYKNYLIYRQMYNDIKGAVSSARTKLDVLKDERYG